MLKLVLLALKCINMCLNDHDIDIIFVTKVLQLIAKGQRVTMQKLAIFVLKYVDIILNDQNK